MTTGRDKTGRLGRGVLPGPLDSSSHPPHHRALAGLEHVVRRLASAAAHRAHPEHPELGAGRDLRAHLEPLTTSSMIDERSKTREYPRVGPFHDERGERSRSP